MKTLKLELRRENINSSEPMNSRNENSIKSWGSSKYPFRNKIDM